MAALEWTVSLNFRYRSVCRCLVPLPNCGNRFGEIICNFSSSLEIPFTAHSKSIWLFPNTVDEKFVFFFFVVNRCEKWIRIQFSSATFFNWNKLVFKIHIWQVLGSEIHGKTLHFTLILTSTNRCIVAGRTAATNNWRKLKLMGEFNRNSFDLIAPFPLARCAQWCPKTMRELSSVNCGQSSEVWNARRDANKTQFRWRIWKWVSRNVCASLFWCFTSMGSQCKFDRILGSIENGTSGTHSDVPMEAAILMLKCVYRIECCLHIFTHTHTHTNFTFPFSNTQRQMPGEHKMMDETSTRTCTLHMPHFVVLLPSRRECVSLWRCEAFIHARTLDAAIHSQSLYQYCSINSSKSEPLAIEKNSIVLGMMITQTNNTGKTASATSSFSISMLKKDWAYGRRQRGR